MNALDAFGDAYHWLGEWPGSAIIALTFAAMFLYTGTLKMRQPRTTSETMVRLGLAKRVSNLTGYLGGTVEVALGLWVLSGLALRWSLAAVAALLLVFAVLIARKVYAGATFKCFCFGSESHEIGYSSVARNAVMAVVALAVVANPSAVSVFEVSFTDGYLAFLSALGIFAVFALCSRVPQLIDNNQGTVRVLRARGEN